MTNENIEGISRDGQAKGGNPPRPSTADIGLESHLAQSDTLLNTDEPIQNDIPEGLEGCYLENRNWPTIQLRDIESSRNGDLVCELSAFCGEPGTMITVTGIRFNMGALTNRGQIAKALKGNYLKTEATFIPWGHLLADACNRGIVHYRNGHEVEDHWTIQSLDFSS